jgi:acyl carrier protein
LEREFTLRIQSHEVGREAFASVAALAAYVEGRLSPAADPHAGN